MSRANAVTGNYEQGREDQFRDMMQALSELEAKYKGVRGELLAKVRAELTKVKPTRGATSLSVVATPPEARPATVNPSCRVCGRETKLSGTDGSYVCQNGHTRFA